MTFLRTKDSMERIVMEAIAHAADELQRQRDERRADMIADSVGKRLFGK
jgi:hypothetical protein